MVKTKREPHSFSIEEQRDISHQLKEHSLEKAIQDYEKCEKVVNQLEMVRPLSPLGLKFIETFVHTEVLNTLSKHGISFYDFWFHRDFYMNRDEATRNLIQSIRLNKPYLSQIKIAKQVFNLYYGGISIFRPLHAARLYQSLKPTCILDFTMGWGGRLMGACLLNVKKYIGIDSNTFLQEPYDKMVSFLKTKTNTEIELHFQDARTMDYGALEYDMVFTSPPYYNKELYPVEQKEWNKKRTEEEWNEEFYKPLFQETWKHLKSGGYYCLNIPNHLYEKVCVPLLGEAKEAIEMKKYARILPKRETKQFNVGQKYVEYIYIWIKPSAEDIFNEKDLKKPADSAEDIFNEKDLKKPADSAEDIFKVKDLKKPDDSAEDIFKEKDLKKPANQTKGFRCEGGFQQMKTRLNHGDVHVSLVFFDGKDFFMNEEDQKGFNEFQCIF
jgi:hypothetical protein